VAEVSNTTEWHTVSHPHNPGPSSHNKTAHSQSIRAPSIHQPPPQARASSPEHQAQTQTSDGGVSSALSSTLERIVNQLDILTQVRVSLEALC
jgi:hypothetical protein